MNTSRKVCLVTAYVLLFLNVCDGSERDLYTYLGLGSDGNYTTSVRPLTDASGTVSVSVHMELHQIRDIDEKNEIFDIVAFLFATWTDEYLTWDPSDYGGINSIVVPASEIWTPDFGVENSGTSFYDSSYRSDFHVVVDSSGSVMWGFGGEMSLFCDLDLTYYPFDNQRCTLELENWMYEASQVDLFNSTSEVILENYRVHGIWSIESSKVEKLYIHYSHNPGVDYPELIFTIHLTRKFKFYMLNYVAPSVFMLILTLVVFWLPPEAGEKIGLIITVMLTFSVFQLSLTDITPSNSDEIPVLSIFFLFCLAMGTAATVSSVLVMFVNHVETGPPPRWLCKLYFKYLARGLCMKSYIPEWTDENAVEDVPVSKADLDPKIEDLESKLEKKKTFAMPPSNGLPDESMAEKINLIAAYIQDKVDGEKAEEKWKAIARITDRVFFVFFVLAACLGTIVIIAEATVNGGNHVPISHQE